MTDKLTDFDDLSDVSDAAIQWVLRLVDVEYDAQRFRQYAVDDCQYDRGYIIAARLIQAHRPDLIADPLDAIAREILAAVYDEHEGPHIARATREGRCDNSEAFKAAKRAYIAGMEAGKSRD